MARVVRSSHAARIITETSLRIYSSFFLLKESQESWRLNVVNVWVYECTRERLHCKIACWNFTVSRKNSPFKFSAEEIKDWGCRVCAVYCHQEKRKFRGYSGWEEPGKIQHDIPLWSLNIIKRLQTNKILFEDQTFN